MSPASAQAQFVIQESGFTVTTIAQSIVQPFAIECSPGGVWGDYIYAADWGGGGGTITRIDFSGNVTPFASGLNSPVGIEFGPGSASNFGDFLYVPPARPVCLVLDCSQICSHANPHPRGRTLRPPELHRTRARIRFYVSMRQSFALPRKLR